jgi:antitoxin ParD1/3/4
MMTRRHNRPISVTLGDLHDSVQARVKSGSYSSASEVVRAGLRALDREDAALNEWVRRRIEEAMKDPSPAIPARTVFKRLRAHSARMRAKKKDEKI